MSEADSSLTSETLGALLRDRVRHRPSGGRRAEVAVDVLDFVVRSTRSIGARGWALVLTDATGRIDLVVSDGVDRRAVDLAQPDVDKWPINHCLRVGEPLWFASAAEFTRHFPDSRWPSDLVGRLAFVPLVSAGRVIGAYHCTIVHERPFMVAEQEFLTEVAALTARLVVLGRTVATAEDEAEVYEARAVSLVAELVAADRTQLARDLHDGVLQDVLAVSIAIGSVDPKDLTSAHQQVANAAVKAVERIRSAIADLRGLKSVVRDARAMVEAIVDFERSMLPITIHCDIRGPLEQIDDPLTVRHLDFALREMISSVSRHAGAAEMWVVVDVTDDEVQVVVRDDGQGVDRSFEHGDGLYNLEWRAAVLNGRFTLVSLDNQGALARFTARRRTPT